MSSSSPVFPSKVCPAWCSTVYRSWSVLHSLPRCIDNLPQRTSILRFNSRFVPKAMFRFQVHRFNFQRSHDVTPPPDALNSVGSYLVLVAIKTCEMAQRIQAESSRLLWSLFFSKFLTNQPCLDKGLQALPKLICSIAIRLLEHQWRYLENCVDVKSCTYWNSESPEQLLSLTYVHLKRSGEFGCTPHVCCVGHSPFTASIRTLWRFGEMLDFTPCITLLIGVLDHCQSVWKRTPTSTRIRTAWYVHRLTW